MRNLTIRTYIPFMKGRPVRDTMISKEDQLNLTIALNTCKTFEELLDRV